MINRIHRLVLFFFFHLPSHSHSSSFSHSLCLSLYHNPISEWLLTSSRRKTEQSPKRRGHRFSCYIHVPAAAPLEEKINTHIVTQKDIWYEADVTELTRGHSQMTHTHTYLCFNCIYRALDPGSHRVLCIWWRIFESHQKCFRMEDEPVPPAASGRDDTNPTDRRWKSQ